MASHPALRALEAELPGRVVLPGDAGWDAARSAFNLTFDQHPSAVALPASPEEAAQAVRFAAAQGLRVAVQGTGHNMGCIDGLDDTLLVKTQNLTGIEVDARARRARAAAGSPWGDVGERTAPHGLAGLHGSSPGVGVVAYTLGGGLGWLGRRHGLACNSVIAFDVVAADGSRLRADATGEPDLFWALRGGGGSFGLVTAVEFRLHPVDRLYAGAMLWPWERASEVLRRWHGLLPGLPDETTSVGRILQFPPLPDIPEPMRGRPFAVVEAAHLGDAPIAAELIDPLRELRPEIDTFAAVRPEALWRLHMDPEDPVPALGDHLLLAELPEAAIDALVDAAGPGSGSPLLSVELRHLGGALSRPPPDAGALARLEGAFSLFAVGIPPDAAGAAGIEAALARVTGALAPWDAGRYLNFAERPVDCATAYPPDVLSRLRAVKAAYDPGDLFRANHPIAPAP